MREFKFRAWDVTKKEMRHDAVPFADLALLAYGSGDNATCVAISLARNPMEFMQYTGLKDKNGKEIYEGDILGYGDPKGYGVFWDETNACWGVRQKEWPGYYTFQEIVDMTKVIGNIYENPELLK